MIKKKVTWADVAQTFRETERLLQKTIRHFEGASKNFGLLKKYAGAVIV